MTPNENVWIRVVLVGLVVHVTPGYGVLKQDGAHNDRDNSPWSSSTYEGCNVCFCQWETKTIDCSYRNIYDQLPDVNRLPHEGVVSL